MKEEVLATKFFYSTYQFAAVRFFAGMGLFFFFVTRPPYAPDFTQYDGIILKLSVLGIPNLFSYLPSMAIAKATLLTLSFISILLAFGVYRKLSALFLMIAYIFSIGGIPLLPEPNSGFVLCLFLILMLAPNGEALQLVNPPPPFSWRLPPWQYWLIYSIVLFGFVFMIIQTGAYEAFDGSPRLWNFGKGILIVFTTFISLQLLMLNHKIRPYAWIAFTLLSIIVWSNSLANILLLVALVTFLLPSSTRFPWQRKRTESEKDIIFIDGECVVCDEFATVVLEEDIWKNFRLATIQGPTGQRELPSDLNKDLSTVVVKVDGELYTHSTAVLKILTRLPGLWAFSILDQILVPRFIRDSFYKNFAKYRYRIFGKKEVCSLPKPEDRSRILD